MTAARVWDLVRAVADGSDGETTAVVFEALQRDSAQDPNAAAALASDAGGALIRRTFGQALSRCVTELRTSCGLDGLPPPPGTISEGKAGGRLAWDVRLAEWMQQTFPAEPGAQTAAGQLRLSSERWQEYLQGLRTADGLWDGWLRDGSSRSSSPALVTIARLVWATEVRPEVESLLHRRRRHPGVALAVMDLAAPVMGQGASLREDDLTVLDPMGRAMASVPGASLSAIDVLSRGVVALGRLPVHRVVRHLIEEAHRRASEGEPDARVLVYRGTSDLAEKAGSNAKKDTRLIMDALMALDAMRFDLPDGSNGRLLTVRYTSIQGRRGRPSLLEVTLLPPLLPHYSRTLPQGQRQIVPLTDLPPFVGSPRDHGAQAALQLGLLADLTLRSDEAFREGAVKWTKEEWRRMAEPTGLADVTVEQVRDRWSQDGDDGPAFLEEVGRCRYALGPAHGDAWSFLLDAGQKRAEGAERGRRSARSKGARKDGRRRRGKGPR
jgi:hypothetical protein